jgi:hypothetical protein
MFKREFRYVVFKEKDIKGLSPIEFEWLVYLDKRITQLRNFRGKAALTSVVVESTWPEYEPVWEALEERMSK